MVNKAQFIVVLFALIWIPAQIAWAGTLGYNFTFVDAPGAGTGRGSGTELNGINDRGDIIAVISLMPEM